VPIVVVTFNLKRTVAEQFGAFFARALIALSAFIGSMSA